MASTKMTMKGLSYLLVLLGSVCSALAEESVESTKVVRCSFIHWDGVPEEGYYFRMNDEFLPIKFEKENRSKSISVMRMEKIEVFHKLEGSSSGQLSYELVADALIPMHMSEVMFLILSPDLANEGKHRVIVIADSAQAFPSASCLFLNLCSDVFDVDFAGEIERLQPERVKVFFSKVGKKGGFVPCMINTQDGERVFENRIFCQKSSRRCVIIRPNIKGDLMPPRIKFLSQYLPVEQY
jgi:hypothetical protein